MPRYFFDLHEGDNISEDIEGVRFATPEAARLNAIEGARCVMSHEISHGRLSLRDFLIVRGESGEVVTRVLFSEAVRVTA